MKAVRIRLRIRFDSQESNGPFNANGRNLGKQEAKDGFLSKRISDKLSGTNLKGNT